MPELATIPPANNGDTSSSTNDASQFIITPPDTGASSTSTITTTAPPVTADKSPQDLAKVAPLGNATLKSFADELGEDSLGFDVSKLIKKDEVVAPKTDATIAAPVTPKADVTTVPVTPASTTTTTTPAADDVVPDDATASKRDFTGLEPNEIPLAKRMSTAAFNYFKGSVLELKAKREKVKNLEAENATLKVGKVTLPESYAQHPQAYVLTPEFGEISNALTLAGQFESHWHQQAVNIENNKDWHDIVSDGKGGYQIGPAQPATPESKVRVFGNIQHVATLKGQQEGRLQTLQRDFNGKHKASEELIKAESDKYFAHMNDEKNPTNKQYKEILNMFPPSHRNSVLADFAAKSLTGLLQYKAAYESVLAKTTKETQTQTALAEQQRRAGPSSSKINTGGAGTVAAKPLMEQFKEALGND